MKLLEHLAKDRTENTRNWFKSILKLYSFCPGELDLLKRCGELRDIANKAMEQLQIGNLIYTDRFGQPHSHPCVRTYQQSVDLLSRLLKQLNIKSEDHAED